MRAVSLVLGTALVSLSLSAQTIVPPLVFVSRSIPAQGSVYLPAGVGRSLPGVGPFSRFTIAAPGRLMVREPGGQLRTLVDGASPDANAYQLIDVNAPSVSYDGTRIVFAGVSQGEYDASDRGRLANPGAWRLYVIDADGSGLRRITSTDRAADLARLGPRAALDFVPYDDTDPAFLPDGRIVFSSTRWPTYGEYSSAHATQLFVVNADGTGLHRITAERNGADRPAVDPRTGRIVFARWWRNHRLPAQMMDTVIESTGTGGYRRHLGLVAAVNASLSGVGPIENLVRNAWHLASIRPDGSELALFTGGSETFFEGEDLDHAYGAAFAPDGSVVTTFYPMKNLTEAAGFGGLRRYWPGPSIPTALIGPPSNLGQSFYQTSPRVSYGVYASEWYAADPVVLTDGRIVASLARGVGQDYGIYVLSADGRNPAPLVGEVERSELRAAVLGPRPLPPILADVAAATPSEMPPTQEGPYDIDGTFVFEALNVYANAPVDWPIVNAPALGSARTIRFFLDHQRTAVGSDDHLDWPILLGEAAVNPDGSVAPTPLPAMLPLFEQVRDANDLVPLTGRGARNATSGATHVAGMNYGVAGQRVRCVGCHAGHSLITVPDDPRVTNLAPGATITQSSLDPSLKGNTDGLVDRRVRTGKASWFWRSHPAQNPNGQWVTLTFPQPIRIRTVRLYGAPLNATDQTVVHAARVRAGTVDVTVGPITDHGLDVAVGDEVADTVRIDFLDVMGLTRYQYFATLAEVEVIASVDGQ